MGCIDLFLANLTHFIPIFVCVAIRYVLHHIFIFITFTFIFIFLFQF